jgi:hypothetical protein
MSLLGFMAAGGAVAHQEASNKQTDKLNILEASVFSAELADVYQQRVEERRAIQEQKTYVRDRTDKLEDRGVEREWKEGDDEAAHTRAMELRKAQDDAAMEREKEGTKRAGILADARKSGGAKKADDPEAKMAKISQHLNKLGAERRKILSELTELRGSAQESPHAKALKEDAARIEREMRAAEAVLLEKRQGGFNKAVQFPKPGGVKPAAAQSFEETDAARRASIGHHVREQGSR